ncbi:Na+/solute symporter [Aulographum hederae CBS 113979]|uniref:Na+/solute symporter n=1 Tax=Aulographum hederae CBS 113979 TaxID=1176131 RepID=A0A6G1H3K6_9PEZI|nr:Na+/solute symporter [Aulographum hederae CBS 113979]
MATTYSPPLNPGWGYGLIIGLGFAFALGMILVTWLLKRYQGAVTTSENFATAGRSVKSGLVAAAVCSTWTWAATLLQSSAVAYRYGVSGPFWYAAGATIQILLFASIAIELKRRAPCAHTFLEAVRARYGPVTHGVYIVFSIFTNILVTAMLLTGGSAVVTELTGVPTAAAVFLFPIGVVIYTMVGGIKATFMTDYINSLVILIIIFVFAFTVYSSSEVLGSPGRLYDILTEIVIDRPVPGNAGGSYLTMKSKDGGIFFVINIIGNFGTVFMDNAYYNKAISASPVHALPGYIMGGLSWFAIPWLCATTMGLAALALETHPSFPTYPDRLTDSAVTAGLVLPQAAVALLGKGGAIACLFLMFMAVTSTFSAELISVSSILTYDVYKTYINPKASGKRLIWISYGGVVFFAIALAAFSTGLYYIGISMGYLYLMMGVIISAAVLPATLTLLWSGQSWAAATFSPILGFVCSLIGWLVKAKTEFGELSVASTGSNMPMLVGNCVSLLSPLVFIALLTYCPPFKPQNYDWQSMLDIKQSEDAEEDRDEEDEQRTLLRARKIARFLVAFLTLAFLLLWPIPMYGSGYIFSKRFFTGWVIVGILWLFCSLFMVGFIPIWESRASFARTFRDVYGDITGTRKPGVVVYEEPEIVSSETASTEKQTVDVKVV